MNLSSQCHQPFPGQQRKNATTATSEAAAAVAPRGACQAQEHKVTWPLQYLALVMTEAKSGNVHWVPEHPCCLTPVKSPLKRCYVNSHIHLPNPFVQNSPWGTVCFSHKHLHSLLTISTYTETKLIIICYFTHISLLLVSSHLLKPRKEATA